MNTNKILIVGASGTLGQLVCAQVRRLLPNAKLFVGDYQPERGAATAAQFDAGFRHTDLDAAGLDPVIADMDLVIVAINQRKPRIQELCVRHGNIFIDVTVFAESVEEAAALHENAVQNNATLVMMAGYFPGLSALLIQETADSTDSVHVSLIQSTNALAGGAGIRDMLTLISNPIRDGNATRPGFQQKRSIHLNAMYRQFSVREIGHAERDALARTLGLDVQYYTGWDKPGFTNFIAFLKSTGLLKLLLARLSAARFSKIVKHNPNQPENSLLIVEAESAGRKKTVALSTFSDYQTTAITAVALAKVALQKIRPGFFFPFQLTSLDELLPLMDEKRILLVTDLSLKRNDN